MLEKLNIDEFNEFSKSCDQGLFFQSSYWGELKKMTGWIPHIIGYKENGKIECASLILAKKIPFFNRYIYYAPRGFLINYNNFSLLEKFVLDIKKYIKNNKGIFLKINPYVIYQQRDLNGDIVENGIDNKAIVDNLIKLGFKHNGFTNDYGIDLEPRWLSVLDLKGKTYDEIKSGYRATTRTNVNDTYKYGLNLVEIDESRLDEFKNLMMHTSERRGFIDRPISYYNCMYKSFKDNIKIILVELDLKRFLQERIDKKNDLEQRIKKETEKDNVKENLVKELNNQLKAAVRKSAEAEEMIAKNGDRIVVAGGLFMTFGKQVVSLFGASYKEFMKYKGQYFLNNEMIKYAIENKYEKFNFFGITGNFNEDSPMYGLFDFKRGFGAEVTELIGEFNIITDKFFNLIYKVMFGIYRKMKRVIK